MLQFPKYAYSDEFGHSVRRKPAIDSEGNRPLIPIGNRPSIPIGNRPLIPIGNRLPIPKETGRRFHTWVAPTRDLATQEVYYLLRGWSRCQACLPFTK